MPAVATPTHWPAMQELEEPRHIWIEHRDGSITRGLITGLSPDSAIVRLTGSADVTAGEEVMVRIAVPRSARTLGGTARVMSVRDGEAHECELRWTHTGPERDQLSSIGGRRA